MTIFSNLKVGTLWEVSDHRYLTYEQVCSVLYAEVAPSQFGYSACFHLNTGKVYYIPMSSRSDVKAGDILDPAEIQILTLRNNWTYGEIYRVLA